VTGITNILASFGGGAAAFQPVTRTYAQGDNVQRTETAPVGCSNVVIEVIGASGGGGQGSANPCVGSSGSGGGSGGYTRSSYAVTGGQTTLYTSGSAGQSGSGFGGNGTAGGETQVLPGTLAILQMRCDPGQGGGGAGGAGGLFGAGGGGNLASSNGASGTTGGSGPGTGGAGVVGVYGTGAPGGNGGRSGQLPTNNGGVGIISYHYT
jgi:hypothetical protein